MSNTSTTAPDRHTYDARAADAWHARRIERLRAEDGWLTLIDLAFLDDGVVSIGSDPGCRLHYPHATAPRIGSFIVAGDSVNFAVDLDQSGHATAEVTANGRLIDTVAMIADDSGAPTILRNGPLTITLVRRNGRLALRVKDNDSPVRTNFTGIERFPFDPALVITATVTPAPLGTTIPITNIRGFVTDEPLAATLSGEVAGQTFALAATAGSDGRLFVVFGDTTNGRETYGGGRFLEVDAPAQGVTTVDFNRAFNPPCSFTPYATCPTPPAGNRLAVAIRGGEKATAHADHVPPQ